MIGVLLWSMLAAGDAPAAEPTAEQVRFFETSVRPVLVEHCHKCHGEKKQWSNLRLDSRKGVLTGGDSGPAIIPGKPDESRLIRAVKQNDDEVSAMPKEGKLTERQVADLVRWVEMGAPYPAAAASARPKRDPNHWAFQPPAIPPLPAVQGTHRLKSPVDNFILEKLEAAGLEPAPEADRRTLIRRVTFDLTGLPPTPDEVEGFVADQEPDALERLVDRLLTSPAYGERWGRHWLDVARYADSNGLDENVAHGNAWRYRDYVVAAFNADKPFDRFVLEQLAGDLLPAEGEVQRHEQLIATGFLAIGPKVLAEVDEAKMQMDIVDEQIDTVGRALVGMTLGCARCHDHKFDPIETADYYGLAGIFKSTRTMENYKKVAKWHENPLPSPAAEKVKADYDAMVKTQQQAIDALVAKADEQVKKEKAGETLPDKLEPLYADATKAELKKLRDAKADLEKNPPDLPSAMGVTEDQVLDVAIHIRGNPLKLGDVVPRHAPPVMRGPAVPQFTAAGSGRMELAQWLIDPHHPLTSRVIVNRVWRWHFGQGLVRTVDNFGLLGETPSHPELLDWLARRFAADGWSLKRLQRLVVISATYRQSSVQSPKSKVQSRSKENSGLRTVDSGHSDPQLLDPENRLLWRQNVRRLDAEEVRDSLLAVGNQLDRTFGGSLLMVKNRGYFFDHTSKDLTDYTSRRRTLYLPMVRNNVYDVLQLLDFPDPAVASGDRTASTVAPQALLLLNSDLVMQAAADFAARLLSVEGSDDDRMQRMYAIAYGRPTTAEELDAHAAFLAELDRALAASEPDADKRRERAWSVLCHVIVAANEFVYVK